MLFSSLLFVIAANSLLAAIWATMIGLVWLCIAAIARQLSRYWAVVLGTLRGALLLGCGVGIGTLMQQEGDWERAFVASIIPSFIGAIAGALWGYYDLTGWLKAYIRGDRQTIQQHFKTLTHRPASRSVSRSASTATTFSSGRTAELSTSPADSKPPSDAEPTTAKTPLEKARQGDAAAIAGLINRQLQPRGITVQAQRQYSVLRLGLTSETPLNVEQTVSFLQRGLEQLQPQHISTVQIVGQSGTGTAQVWRRTFMLRVAAPLPSPSLPAKPSTAYQSARDPQKFVLEIGDSRYEIPAAVVLAIAGLVFCFSITSSSLFLMGLPVLLAFIPAIIARSRGRPWLPWFLYGYIFMLLALVFALILPQDQPQNFARQDLRRISFRQQFLQRADFQQANLQGVDFSQADLAGANFRKANCTGANFSGASISGTCFDQAILDQANFSYCRKDSMDMSLSQVLGSIASVVWGIAIFISLLAAVLLLLQPAILLEAFAVYACAACVATIGLVKAARWHRSVVPLWLGMITILTVGALVGLTTSLSDVMRLIVLAISLALVAQWALARNSWTGFGAALGHLVSLSMLEVSVVVVNGLMLPLFMKLLIWGLGAIAGCLTGAWIQQSITSFQGASLQGANFTGSDLTAANFRHTDLSQTILTSARCKGMLFPKAMPLAISNLWQPLSSRRE